MTPTELANKIGRHHLSVHNALKRVAPDRKKGAPLTEEEVDLIHKDLKVLTKPERRKLRGLFGDDRYPGFIEACDLEETQKFTVRIPPNIPPNQFIGREFMVEQREYAEGLYVYEYNPYRQGDE